MFFADAGSRPAKRIRAIAFVRTSMALKDRITDDMKDAMRARAAQRLSTIRLILAAIKQREIDVRKTLNDAEVVSVLERMVKQRRDSIAQFDAGNRPDLANAERAEIAILESYLPSKASDAEIDRVIDEALADARASGVSGPALMGKAMAPIKAKLAGRADMAQISAKVKARL